MSAADAAAALLLGSLIVYAVTGGADFGGGVWDLLASGPRARAQREAVARAIAPVWEANHVWLIAAVVLLSTAFPAAFAALAIALHIPLTVMLLGIVFRGSAFVFRRYGEISSAAQARWELLFSVSSVATPFALGVCAGALASGRLRAGAWSWPADFVDPWLAPFPLALGALAVCLFAFLAAAYLTVEVRSPELKDDFRARALGSGLAAAALAAGCLVLARSGAPRIWEGLTARSWSGWLLAASALCAAGALAALRARRFHAGRLLAGGLAALIVLGWGAAQHPYLIAPELTIADAAAPDSVLRPLLWVSAFGTLLLAPSFWYLIRVFKSADSRPPDV